MTAHQVRGDARRLPVARNANRLKTHCLKGHPFEGPNLWLRRDGRRICAECNRERFRAWYQRTFHGDAAA